MPVDAGAQHLDRVALPPIVGRKDLHFVRAAIAGALPPRSDPRQLDEAGGPHPAAQAAAGGREEAPPPIPPESGSGSGGGRSQSQKWKASKRLSPARSI